jgi:transposase
MRGALPLPDWLVKGSGMPRAVTKITPILAKETIYVGIDVGKARHVAGFVSSTLLQRHGRFEGCPVLTFEQSRAGFRTLIDRIQEYTPLEQCYVLLEKTGHYHLALVQYLHDLDISVYLVHVQERPKGILKTDKRDALGLANHLYNQLELGVQVANKLHLVRRAVAPTETASLLRGLVRHRYELTREATQRKNKLTAICDELFPEFTDVFKDPNAAGALAIRKHFPTPHAIATASFDSLQALRIGKRTTDDKLNLLQETAQHTIGTRDLGRQRGLVLEQGQLIAELELMQQNLGVLDTEITRIVEQSREGRILTSIPGIGAVQAATIIAAIGHIDNFPSAAALKSYFGWAPMISQSGTSLDSATLTHKGVRTVKQMLFLVVGNAIQMDCEWAKIYQRLVPLKCMYDERTKTYKGKVKVMGRIAGQIISTIYALLKCDAEVLQTNLGKPAPEPQLYDPDLHRAHRQGQYRATKPQLARMTLVQLPAKPS